ncbi:hypothetical protein B0H14DRAFT_29758 [Mycena olivaceomarginata]|nr:hypothetical protein B0H14DRAFT_29758 [Mycena olivaceomarginata]
MLESTPVNIHWDDIVGGSVGTAVAMLLYGFYLNLLIVAMYTLVHRKTAGKGVLLAFTLATAILGTTQIVLRLTEGAIFMRFLRQGTTFDSTSLPLADLGATYDSLILAQNAIFAINNLVTDSLFLYRCYMIWGSQWKVVVVPGILIIATVVTALASVSQNFQQSPYIMAAITNLVLVLLTAGRIWWIRRDARHIGATALNTRYDRAIAMIVESGAIYLISTILLIVTYPLRASESFQVLQAITEQLIVSRTIIIKQVLC